MISLLVADKGRLQNLLKEELQKSNFHARVQELLLTKKGDKEKHSFLVGQKRSLENTGLNLYNSSRRNEKKN